MVSELQEVEIGEIRTPQHGLSGHQFNFDDVKWQNVFAILVIHCYAIYLVFTFPFFNHILLFLWGECFSFSYIFKLKF